MCIANYSDIMLEGFTFTKQATYFQQKLATHCILILCGRGILFIHAIVRISECNYSRRQIKVPVRIRRTLVVLSVG